MKKELVILCVLLLVTSMVFAQDNDTNGNKEQQDYEQTKELIDKTAPIGTDGKINTSKYQPFTSNATRRIETANVWLDDNASWMKFVFHMKPSVTWTFFWNLFFIFFFLNLLFINGGDLFFFIQHHAKARLFGFGLFVILLAFGLYEALAKWMFSIWVYLYQVLWPTTKFLAIFFGLLLIVATAMAGPATTAFITKMRAYGAKKKLAKQQTQINANEQAMNTFLEGIQQQE